MELTRKNICVQCGNEFESDLAAATLCPNCCINENDLPQGVVLNGYEIIQTLGHGGMGTVYLAEQKSMQRRVALKILNPAVTKDAAAIEQFLNEVRNTGNIHHPNIVNAFDAGCESGHYYLAMQYINGKTLDLSIQQDGAINEIKALEIVLQISTALAYVWEKYQIYHRDIKPGNIMLDDEGKAMLMDLGIAQRLEDGHSEEESVEGSPYYMSPEQIQGKKLSWTTDLYSLGATLYQMIVGVPPYDEKTIEEILQKHCTAEFPEPSIRKPDASISAETVALLKKMMNKAPNKRFASWGDFIKELNELISILKDFEANPVKRIQRDALSVAEENRRKIRRKKRNASIITLVFTLCIIGAVVGGYFLLTKKNQAAGQNYNAERLDAGFEEYLKAPTKDNKKKLDDLLTDAENTANSLGVKKDDADAIKDKVSQIRAQAQDFEMAYSKFEDFSQAYKVSKAAIDRTVEEFKQKPVISIDDCNKLEDMIRNLKTTIKQQKPVYKVHQERLKEINASIAILEKSMSVFYEKLKKQREEEARKNANEYQERAKETQEEIKEKQRALEESRRQIISESKENVNKQNEERVKQENERFDKLREKVEYKEKRIAPKKTVVKEAVVWLSNGKPALPEIIKVHKEMKQEYMNAFAMLDLEKAVKIKIPQLILEIETPTINDKVNKELAELKKMYKENHEQAVASLRCWKKLNDLTEGNIFKGMTVLTTEANQDIGSSVLHIFEIRNGYVHFSDIGSIPEKFIDLSMKDKKNIVLVLERVRRLPIEDVRHFYFTFGLFELAYSRCPDGEQAKLTNKIKEFVKFQYALARKRSDFPMMNRMKRDYDHIKILKPLLR